jgi:predicted transcriptional regulator
MRTEIVTYFSDKEEEFAKLLIEIGTKRNVALVLVFLANTPEATSREIERSTDLRQPEVSVAMHQLLQRGWVNHRERSHASKGRPLKIYTLAKPFADIISVIEEEKKHEANMKIQLTKKLHAYVQ